MAVGGPHAVRSLSVTRHRESFRELVAGHIDIPFANEHEVVTLYEVARFDDALQHVRNDCAVAALTRSEKRFGCGCRR